MSTTTKTTRARRSALTLLALLAALGLLAGCGSSDSGSEGSSDEKTTVEESEASVDVSIVEIETTTTSAPAETTTTDKAATTTTTAAPKAVIGEIQFATSLEPNGAPIDPTTEFGTDESVIYASVLMTSLPKGTTVSGEFQVDGATLDQSSSDAPSDYTEVYVKFALQSGGTFEPGTYTFIATAGDEKAEPVTFTVAE